MFITLFSVLLAKSFDLIVNTSYRTWSEQAALGMIKTQTKRHGDGSYVCQVPSESTSAGLRTLLLAVIRIPVTWSWKKKFYPLLIEISIIHDDKTTMTVKA